jgi:hypothetical protein
MTSGAVASGTVMSEGGLNFRIPSDFVLLSENESNNLFATDAFSAGGYVFKSPDGVLIYQNPNCVIPLPSTEKERRDGLLELLVDPSAKYPFPLYLVDQKTLISVGNREWVWIDGQTLFNGRVSVFVHAETVIEGSTFEIRGIAPVGVADDLTDAIESILGTFKEDYIEPGNGTNP